MRPPYWPRSSPILVARPSLCPAPMLQGCLMYTRIRAADLVHKKHITARCERPSSRITDHRAGAEPYSE
jgi:hypothetical protein